MFLYIIGHMVLMSVKTETWEKQLGIVIQF